MAGSRIYIGKMLEDVDAQLDSLISDFNSKLTDMITNLQAVNTSVSQNLNKLTVSSGTSNNYLVVAPATVNVTGNGTDGGVKTSLAKVKFLCDGVVNVLVKVGEYESLAVHGGLWYKRNSDAWVKLVAAEYPAVYSQTNLSVAYGDVIEFAVGANQNSKMTFSSDGVTILYDIKDIMQGGAFAVI